MKNPSFVSVGAVDGKVKAIKDVPARATCIQSDVAVNCKKGKFTILDGQNSHSDRVSEIFKNVLVKDLDAPFSLPEDVFKKIGEQLIKLGTLLGEKKTSELILSSSLSDIATKDTTVQPYSCSIIIGALAAILGIGLERIEMEKKAIKADPHMNKKNILRAIRGYREPYAKNKSETQHNIFARSVAHTEHESDRPAIDILKADSETNDCEQCLMTKQNFAGIIGQSFKMQELFTIIKDVTDINVPVLIQGESGTGKELVAVAIHKEGSRANKPFVPVNCGALPEGLLESELFGHVKGAFTGAVRDKKGRFELADGGTLFLDEVADLPKFVQAKLLRVLQEGKFERVGDEKTISVDVRIISAANRDLKREVAMGNFRDDLYYRLNVVPINLPPLRERKNDIPLLVEHFFKKALDGKQKEAGISKEALSILMNYSWPGNVRELQSAIRYAHVKSKGRIIRPQHLPAGLESHRSVAPLRGPSKKLDFKSLQDALSRTGGNKSKAASLLGVGRATIYRYLANHSDQETIV